MMIARYFRRSLDILRVDQRSTRTARPPSGYAPFAQLIKMLLPSARSVAIYDASRGARLVLGRFRAPGSTRPARAATRERHARRAAAASRPRAPAFPSSSPRCAAPTRGRSARSSSSSAAAARAARRRWSSSMLRPVLDCLESQLSISSAARSPPIAAQGSSCCSRVDEHDRRGCERVAGALRPLRARARLRDRRAARAGQESRDLVDRRRVVRRRRSCSIARRNTCSRGCSSTIARWS